MALPPVACVHSLLHSRSKESLLSSIRRLLEKTFSAIVFCILLRFLFDYLVWMYDETMARTRIPDVLPQLNFQESLAVTLLFTCLIEATQLCLCLMKTLLVWARAGCIRVFEFINWCTQKPFAFKHRHRRSFKNLDDVLRPVGLVDGGIDQTSDSSASLDEEDEKENTNILQRFANGFWTLLYYSHSHQACH